MVPRAYSKYEAINASVCCFDGGEKIMLTGARFKDYKINKGLVSGTQVELYHVKQDKWQELAPLKFSRSYHASTCFNEAFIYVFGGQRIGSWRAGI